MWRNIGTFSGYAHHHVHWLWPCGECRWELRPLASVPYETFDEAGDCRLLGTGWLIVRIMNVRSEDRHGREFRPRRQTPET
jgi:hypothetical protein